MIRKIKRGLHADLKDRSFLEIVRESGITFAIRLGGLIAGYAFIFLISRYFGSAVLGAHTLSITVLMMFTVLGRLGMDTHLVKNFARDHGDNRWDRILEVYNKTLLVIVPFGILLSLILYFAAEPIALHIFNKPLLTPYLKTIAFGVLPMIMRFVNSECYRGFRMNREYAYSQNVSYFLYGSVILGVASVFSKNEQLPNIAFVLSLVLLGISSTFLLLKRMKRHATTPSNEFNTADMVRESLPMMMANSMLLVAGWINTIMLGIWSTESDVGIFSVVLKIATFATFMLMSINAIATPRFAQLYHKNEMSALKDYTQQTTRVIFYSSTPIFVLIIVFHEWLLSLFGEEFRAGGIALLITMAGQFFNVFAGSVGAILNMTGRQKVFRNIIFISTAFNIILCAILIPRMGLNGSAIASMAFMASWNLLSMIYIFRDMKIHTFYNPFYQTSATK
jgi:O-antigen/teichoic acid export membrane protein